MHGLLTSCWSLHATPTHAIRPRVVQAIILLASEGRTGPEGGGTGHPGRSTVDSSRMQGSKTPSCLFRGAIQDPEGLKSNVPEHVRRLSVTVAVASWQCVHLLATLSVATSRDMIHESSRRTTVTVAERPRLHINT